MNEPWYDRITGTEMRCLFKKQTERPQHHVHRCPELKRKSSTPVSMDGGSDASSEDLELLKSECTRRAKRKRVHSLRSDDSANLISHTTKERKRSREGEGVPNKDLLKVFQRAHQEEEAKECISDIIELDTRTCE